MLDRIGKVAYRLRLLEGSKIHNDFHVSQLKPVLGNNQKVIELPTTLTSEDEVVVEPPSLLDTRYDQEGHLEVLVQWSNVPAHETSWMGIRDLKVQFLGFALEDKLVL